MGVCRDFRIYFSFFGPLKGILKVEIDLETNSSRKRQLNAKNTDAIS
jgi:hypothetical protein